MKNTVTKLTSAIGRYFRKPAHSKRPPASRLLLLALLGLACQSAMAQFTVRVYTNLLPDQSFTLTSGNFVPTGTFTTNHDLLLGTAAAYGGTNITSPGSANVRSKAIFHSLSFSNNFNSSNTFFLGVGTSGNFVTFGGVNPYLRDACTNGTITIQDTEPVTNNIAAPMIVYFSSNTLVDVASGSTIALTCQLNTTNGNGITKGGLGVLTLSGSNGINGVTVNAGTLNINTTNALGTNNGVFTIAGGTVDNTSGSNITFLANYPQVWSGDFAYNGTYGLNTGAGSVTLSGTHQVTVAANTLTIGGAVGPSTGGNGLIKAGAGKLQLNGANTYNGNTTVSAGTLALGSGSSLANSPTVTANGVLDISAISGFTLGGSQSLAGSGGVNGSVATTSGTQVFPGTDGTAGTLTFSNNLTLAIGASCNFDLASLASGANDKIVVNGSGTALNLNNNTMIIKAPASLDTVNDYTLVSVPNGSISDSFNPTPTFSGTPPANAGNYSVITSGNTVKLHYTASVVATVDHYTVTPSVGSTTAGTVFSVTIQAKDSSNHNITDNSADGTLVLLSSTGSVQFDGNNDGTFGDAFNSITNGTCILYAKDNKAETVNLIATSGTPSGTNFNFVISAGSVAKLQLLLPGESAAPGTTSGKTGTPNSETSGASFNVVVNSVDANWNLVSSTDTVGITGTGDSGIVLPSNTAFSGGTATLSVVNKLAGSGRTLTATDISNGSVVSSTSPAYTVNPGAIANLILLAPGETATIGSAPGKTGTVLAQTQGIGYPVTVEALDANWNLVVTNDTVGITSSVGGDGLPANAALNSGVKTFNVTNNTPGSATITASDITHGGVASSSSTLTVLIVPSYRSVQSGLWTDASTWSISTDGGMTWSPASGSPSSLGADTIVITNGNIVTLTASIAVDQFTIQAGAELIVSNATLTVGLGAGTVDMDVFGVVQVAGASGAVTSTTGRIVFENGSDYQHNRGGGVIPTATWNAGSLCELTGVTTGGAFGSGGTAQNFGSFSVNSPTMTGDLNFAGSCPPLIAGNFSVLNTVGQELRFNTTKLAPVCLVDGDFILSGNSYLVLSQGSATNVLTVLGNVNIQNGPVRLATTTGLGILNVGGNFSMSAGGQLFTTNTADPASSQINFIKSGVQTFSNNGGVFNGNGAGITWSVVTNSTVDLGTNYMAGASFLLAGGTLSAHGLVAAPVSGNGTISVGSGAGTLTLNSGLNLSGGGKFAWKLSANSSATAGSDFDQIALTASNLVLGGTSAISISFAGTASAPDISVPFWQTAHSWTIVSLSGTAANPGSTTFASVINGTYTAGSFNTSVSGNGSIVLNYVPAIANFVPLYDSGAGFFSGEVLILTNTSGASISVWSSSNPSLAVSNWISEGMMNEVLPLGDGTSRYSINVTPSVSPTYYIAGNLNRGPYIISPAAVTKLTTLDNMDFTVTGLSVPISSTGVLALVPPTPPVLGAAGASYSGTGGFSLQFSAAVGQAYSVLASTNLVDWSVISTGTVGSSPVSFTDPAATSYAKRFYRISLP